ncbi:MAG: peptidyl-prolyl cis-trans isomerase [Candidatus Hydrogenedentes bacterium]|nr:peptidyl-prolyl cis-trans isomerase [Candidatus Hydrogenedentota bacterium]
MPRKSALSRASVFLILGVVGVLSAGCGLIADKDRIRIAKINDRYVTRGELSRVIREMPADERPRIVTQGDVLNALQNYIDHLVKQAAAAELKGEGKIHVPREDAAMLFDMRHPEYRVKVTNPQDYNLTQSDLQFWEQEREIGIDRVVKQILGEQAVAYLIREALNDGVLTITDEEYEKEYELRRFDLKNYERVTVRGVYFPEGHPEATSLAADAVKRMKSGETPEDVASQYTEAGAGILETQVVNDPRLAAKFGPFWEQASGADKDSVVGPVFIRGWVKQEMTIQGEVTQQQLPNAYFVCVVLNRTPETPKTLEQAKKDLQPSILYAKMMERLREQSRVEIYEDKLPDPSMYDTRTVFSGAAR